MRTSRVEVEQGVHSEHQATTHRLGDRHCLQAVEGQQLPRPDEGGQVLLEVEGDHVQPAGVLPPRVGLEGLVEQEEGGLVVAVQELDVYDVVHGLSLDDRGEVQGVGGKDMARGVGQPPPAIQYINFLDQKVNTISCIFRCPG